MNRLLIVGAGGQGKVVLDCAKLMKSFDEIHFLDDNKIGEEILGHPVIGKIADLESLRGDYQNAFVAIGNNSYRLQLIEEIEAMTYNVPILIHPTAIISEYAEIGSGTIILPGAILNAGCKVGKGVIVNTSALIEHDCYIGDGVHLSPTAKMGGEVTIGEKTWVCIGATIINRIKIGSNCLIAAGAVVIHDVLSKESVYGIPAKKKK
ncbi:acetyltransferase [Niameybacter massiliensis]|uniref:acetyltransferase n=1 Tax=Niameybacter massiliensis TaxID=1658108 RepID=UPI0006B548E1|nr:acetyltransferase [Niameybacter massiliensis]